MMKKNYLNQEFNHFNDLSDEWWAPNGKFKILHTLTPLRIKYIKNIIGLSYNKFNKLKNYNKILKGIEILDLGCGGGLICEPLSRLGASLTGIDYINKNIEIAKKHAKISNLNIVYKTQDLLNINLNKQYDIILMLEVIEHISDWKNVVIKALKYLKPNGLVIFSSINKTLLSKIFAIFIAEYIFKWVPKNTHQYEKLVKLEDLTLFLENNKMKIIDTTGLIFNPVLREWSLNKKIIQMNYFCSAKKIN